MSRLGDNPFLQESGLDALIQNYKKAPRGTHKKLDRVITKSTQEGLREGSTRATFIVNEDQLEKIKKIAYYDRKKIRHVVEEAFGLYISQNKAEGEE